MTACDGMNKPAEPQAPILTGKDPGLRQKDTQSGEDSPTALTTG